MSHNIPKDEDAPPSVPPPSYEEALNSPPVLPGRPANPPHQGPSSSAAPQQPPRPQPQSQLQPPVYPARPPHSGSVPASSTPNSSLYSNNPNLPFEYPRGYFCSKCKNTGFKEKNGKPCSSCWPKFFKKQAYNPNMSLPFTYPRGFICEKCRNTGLKLKNGLSCQDCYTRFAPRNHVSQAPITYSSSPFSMQFTPYNGFSNTGFGPAPGGFAPGGGPQYLQPGDPRMGGTLCGRCRGSGRVTFFLDQELCSVCGGVGRLFNSQHPAYH